MHLAIDERGLNVLADNGAPLLLNCYAAVELSEGSVYTTLDAPVNWQTTEQGLAVHCSGTNPRPEPRWQVQYESADNELCAWLEIQNTTARPLALERMDVLVAPQGFHQVAYASIEAAQTGWQSWSPATVPLPLANPLPAIPGPIDAPMLPASESVIWIRRRSAEVFTGSRHKRKNGSRIPSRTFGLMIEPSRASTQQYSDSECVESLEDLSLTVKYRVNPIKWPQ